MLMRQRDKGHAAKPLSLRLARVVGYSMKFAKGLLIALGAHWPHEFLANSELAQVGRIAVTHN